MSIRTTSNIKFIMVLALVSIPAAFVGRTLGEFLLIFNRNLLQRSPIYNALVDTFLGVFGEAGEVFAYFASESFIMIAGLVSTGLFSIYISRSFIEKVDLKYIWIAHCVVQIGVVFILKQASIASAIFFILYTSLLYATSFWIILHLSRSQLE